MPSQKAELPLDVVCVIRLLFLGFDYRKLPQWVKQAVDEEMKGQHEMM
jgi:hypothetical protein